MLPHGDDSSWTTSRLPGEWQRRPGWAVAAEGDRSAALLLRVWREDSTRSFRGRLTSMDTSPGRPGVDVATVGLASSPRDVVEAVRAWLDEFLGDAARSVDATSERLEVPAHGAREEAPPARLPEATSTAATAPAIEPTTSAPDRSATSPSAG